jgi:S-DNA-T family DNA segregation ATPase FtsK/SpoIIIE
MARRRKRSTQKRIDLPRQLQVAGILFLTVALLTLLSLASPNRGQVLSAWVGFLSQVAGWGVWLMPVLFGGLGVWLLLWGLGSESQFQGVKLIGAGLLLLLGLALVHLVAGGTNPRALAEAGGGGGLVGWWLSAQLSRAVGKVGAGVVLVAFCLIALILLLGLSQRAMRVRDWLATRRTPRVTVGGRPVRPSLGRMVEAATRQETPPPTNGTLPAQPAPPAAEAQPVPRSRGIIFPRIIGGQEYHVPPLDEILEHSTELELSQAEIRERVKIIEETLLGFGVPAKVIEVNQGPTVTQFGLEPGYVERRDSAGRLKRSKISVRKIASLSNDLALALAASPIRIEAPVPGRPMVGIEVPNSDIALVSLRSVMESEAFQTLDGPLRMALGQDVAGQPIVADLAAMPHLLIAGATGSGKSVCINAIITCFLCTHTPDSLQFIMIDPKMVELTLYNGIPHLRAPVVVEIERVVGVLQWLTREMEERYKRFNRARARNIEAYNQARVSRGEKPLPYLVLVVDELADLMMASPDEVERNICRLAQMARATGIHLVIATQRPSVDVVTGLIKANFPARISFAVTSQVDSRVILDGQGAEKLLGRGDMLYMSSDSSKLVRLQGCFVSDRELNRLVRYWKGIHGTDEPSPAGEVTQAPLWDDLIPPPSAPAADQDDLMPKAIDVVREADRASISLLQRRLRIGYVRAARLIDLMEQRGIIGPDPGAGRARDVLGASEETEDLS